MRKIWLSFVLVVTLGGCSRDQNTNLVMGELMPLSLSGGTTKAVVNLDATTVGAYVLQTDAASASTLLNAPFSNVIYNVDASGVFTTASDTKLNNTSKYSVMGYAPYKTVTDVNAVPFTSAENVVYAPLTPVTFGVGVASASLSFVHKMSRISFVIVPGLHNPSIAGATFKATGFYSSCTMNLADGVITPVMGAGEVIDQTDKVFNIVPGNLTLTLVVTIGDRTYKTVAPYVAEEGKMCVYTLKVNEGSDMQLSIDPKIVNWVDNVVDLPNIS